MPADVITKGQAILNGLQAALAQYGTIVPANVSTAIQSGIAAAQSFLSAASGATADSGKQLGQQLIGALQMALPTILTIVGLPGPIGITISAVLLLLPAISRELGLFAPQAASYFGLVLMTEAQAQAWLSSR